MIRNFFLLFVILIASASGYPQNNLSVRITGIRNSAGVIMLQVLNENKEVVSQEKGIIQGDSCTVTIMNLASGKYAVQYYHDENLNGSLDKNGLGIPTEGYGFSNNAYGMFGPKPFRDWLFVFPENKSLSLKIKYH